MSVVSTKERVIPPWPPARRSDSATSSRWSPAVWCRRVVPPRRSYTVQLHRVRRHSTAGPGYVEILSSWSPTEAKTLEEAWRRAEELHDCNRWGGPVEFAWIQITGPDGEHVLERGQVPGWL